ncbi:MULTISPECIES: flavodoxin [unclassified Frankia]|uniref:flavodoxin family protein n=1 Tax=unclassified Frankia TaxID=2632575 RepID=UPI002AD56597|nr:MULTISPECIES: flavodoxin [unclassified Frankia]
MAVVPTLLVVHHTPSPTMQAILESVLSGARDEAIEGVAVEVRPALSASASDVLAADGYLLGTTANIGYMSGAMKHFFDQAYYPCLEATVGRPYALYVHGGSDTTGAIRSVETIATGLKWKRLREPVTVLGTPDAKDREACWELGATVAASLMP